VSPKLTVHRRACNLCEAICGLEIRLEDGRVASIRGDRDDPLSRGHICPKAVALQDLHHDPDRLRRPVRRTADGWQEIGWDEAFEEAASGLRAVSRKHGRDAVALYLGNPHVHDSGGLLYGPLLMRALGTRSRYSATSVDQLPHHLVSRLLFGHQLLLPVPDIDRTQFLLIVGANPAVSNGSLMTAPGVRRRLRAIRERGGAVVVVDPRRSETAELADRHLFIRPGTDALLLLALVRTVLEEGLADPGRLARLGPHTDGLDRVRELARDFDPETVGAGVGIEGKEIRRLARDFCAAPSAVCYGRLGVSVQSFGATCQWLVNVLNLVTGNLDRPGGAMFCSPAVDLLPHQSRGRMGRWTSRVRGLPEFGGELPVATMAEDMLTEGEGRVRALVTLAGNPVLSTPDGSQVDRALAGLDFMLSVDFYVNETTRHAQLILPPTAALERDHYDLAFHLLAVRNTARYSPPLFQPGPDQRHEWEIMLGLVARLGGGGLRGAFQRWWMGRLGPAGMIDLALRRGPYGSGFLPLRKGLNLRRLRQAPHGVDLGPLKPRLPDRLFTREKRIDLAPAILVDDVARLRARRVELSRETLGQRPLLLVSRRHLRSNNSWMHNYERLMGGRDRCTLLIHPEDAACRGLESGLRVRVRSRVGEVEVPLEVSDEMMPGVVCLPHGWGHQRQGVEQRTARRHPGASVNDLTDTEAVDPVSGTAALSGVPVEVEPAGPGPVAR
jgi:anaerobic selenocysteine-containing dehydrogenase